MIIGQRHKDEVYKLVLLRHGESVWNAKNLFTGWVDVSLSDKGMEEAKKGGILLKEEGILPDIVFTSFLRRAITTANIALNAADRHWIEVRRSWRLNERHYGALQGKDKSEIRKIYGEEQFMQWRRSYDVPPPEIEENSKYSQDADVRYANEAIPKSESLKDVLQRAKPYLFSRIFPELELGKTVLVAAHGNSLRAIVKYLEDISDDDISNLNIPTGIPLYYELNTSFRILSKGRYLDPDVQEAIEAVANQGN
ncbi:MAG: phosphoglyceromutase [Bifidobacteriaceae bacterium]|jgi:2,3-bisphosphoglycerate-dependent phosphoglycerate mutase|nr:phosphoglyceromutase [Bifidobacteriaceae bacterium]